MPVTIPTAAGAKYQPYSFLIKRVGNTIIAQDENGNIAFSGTDAASVIQSATDALTSGGKIFIKAGTYNLTKTINIGSNIELIGEGIDKTILVGPATSTNITYALIKNKGYPSTLNENIIIRDLTINANQEAYSIGYRGIGFRPVRAAKIIRVKLYDVSGWGISFYGGTDQKSSQCSVISCEVYKCKYDCVEFVGLENYEFTDGLVLDSTFKHADGGVSCWNARQVSIIGNHFVDIDGCTGSATNHIAIPLQGTTGKGSQFISIIGNTFSHENPTSLFHGINMMDGSSNNVVEGNVFNFWSNASYGTIIVLGSNNVCKGNIMLRNQASASWFFNAGDNNLIEGNVFLGNLTSSYPYIGNRNLFVNNVFYNTGVSLESLRVNGNDNLLANNYFIDSDHTHTVRSLNILGARNTISNNIFINIDNAIRTDSAADSTKIIENEFKTVTTPISNNGTNTVIKRNIGYVTENSGTATFSGDGSTTTFTIAHGLAGTPKSWRVEAGSADAKGDKYVTAGATNLTVTFATAPPSGTNNVVLVWQAEI